MDTRSLEIELSEKFKYKKLSSSESNKYRNIFLINIPSFLSINGKSISLYTNRHSILSFGYNRIVVGDYGAFVEIDRQDINHKLLVIPRKQEYRATEFYINNIKYIWYTINDRSNIKLYFQLRTVDYADYLIGKYYVSVHEIFLK